MLVLPNFVPISLLITLDTVRYIQAFFIEWDFDLFDQTRGLQARVQTSNLNESLGQVDFIFSDKTGTLTQNYMQFNKMSIGNYSYGTPNAPSATGLLLSSEDLGQNPDSQAA